MPENLSVFAMCQVKTPFVLHGRTPGHALDCIGLVAHCLNQNGYRGKIPIDYTMRGSHLARIQSYFSNPEFVTVPVDEYGDGDIAVVQCADRQFHVMIRAPTGWIHAHAGLGRVVFSPDPIIWPLIAIWRHRGA